MKTFAITVLLALVSSTARADEVEVGEDDITFYDDGVGLYEQMEEYDETIPEWGYAWIEWIWMPYPGECAAEACSGYCDIYVYACVDNNCQGWADMTSCWQVDCAPTETCA